MWIEKELKRVVIREIRRNQMKLQKRVLCLLALLSLSFLMIGCWLNDDDDDQIGPSTGAIKLSAVADAGAGTFAAALRESAAAVRADASSRFNASITIGAGGTRTFSVTRSDDGKKLTLDATIDAVGSGKQQVTIEIVSSGVDNPDPILKTIATATVAAGQTNDGDIKNAPINYETTAKAIAYEAWHASSSKTIDDFTPPAADITALANTIETTLGGSIDGTKTLNDATIKAEAEKVAEAVSNPPPAAITLSSITLNPVSGSVAANESFNLASVVVTAKYSDNSSKAVTGYTWTIKSGGGSISGSTYQPATTSEAAVLTCTFIENSTTVTADLTLTVTVQAPTLTSISINPISGSVVTNATFNLANVVVTATYSDSSTKTVTGHTWSVKSGNGSISGSTYTPPTTAGDAVLTCSFSENGVAVTADLTITINSAQSGMLQVSTLAGTAGFEGAWNGTGTDARFNAPFGVAADASGNIYVADRDNHLIRRITSSGVVTTFAGLAGVAGSIDGIGVAARFNAPTGLAADSLGNIYVADRGNSIIRKITSSGAVTTFAGLAGSSGSIDGTGNNARLDPDGIAVDAAGNLYVTEPYYNTIRKITPEGVVTTIAGKAGFSGRTDGVGDEARFSTPQGIAVDALGNLFVTDTWNDAIRKVTSAGVTTTLVLPESSFYGIAIDTSANLFVTHRYNSTIYKITSTGSSMVIAGSYAGSSDGTGVESKFNNPRGIALDALGNIYIADTLNHTIRKGVPVP